MLCRKILWRNCLTQKQTRVMCTSLKHSAAKTNVLLLQGGCNSEAEVSLNSASSVRRSLTQLGYQFQVLNPDADLVNLSTLLSSQRFDIVFNALHGKYYEDGEIQSFLDKKGVKYTHSDAHSSYVAMDKVMAKEIMRKAKIDVPDGDCYSFEDIKNWHPRAPPYVVKPVDQGSSVGLYLVRKGDPPLGHRLDCWPYGKCLVEEFIPGKELSVAVFQGRAMGVVELVYDTQLFDYDAKYTAGEAKHILPAQINPEAYSIAMDFAVKAHKALGCITLSRADMRYDSQDERVSVLEVNTQPGFTDTSILPEICASQGVSFNDIVTALIEDGLNRKP